MTYRELDGMMESRDPAELEEWTALDGWDLRFIQRERGRFRARFASVSLGASVLHWERWERAIHLVGTMHYDLVPFALVLDAESPGRFQTAPFEAGDIIWMRSGSECDLVAAPGNELLVLHVPHTKLDGVVVSLGIGSDWDSVVSKPAAKPSAKARTLLFQVLSALFNDCSQSARTRLEKESRAIEVLLDVLGPPEESKRGGEISVPRRLRHASRAREYIEAHFTDAVRMEDIAKESGVTGRTLQMCFREAYQTSPMEYLRLRRLNEARTILQRGSPDAMAVTEAAMVCGFTHLGRFSSYYKSMFGELPKETLRRG